MEIDFLIFNFVMDTSISIIRSIEEKLLTVVICTG